MAGLAAILEAVMGETELARAPAGITDHRRLGVSLAQLMAGNGQRQEDGHDQQRRQPRDFPLARQQSGKRKTALFVEIGGEDALFRNLPDRQQSRAVAILRNRDAETAKAQFRPGAAIDRGGAHHSAIQTKAQCAQR